MSTTQSEPSSSPCILVGFDGTESGADAVALGRRLAEHAGARLIVAYVPPFNVLAVPSLAGDPVIERTLRESAEEVLRDAEPELDGFDGWERRFHPATPPARGLLEVAEEERADLIVAGSTHPHPGPGGSRRLAPDGRPRVRGGRRGLRRIAAIQERAVGRDRAGSRDEGLTARDRRVRAAQPRRSDLRA